jgi:hypothetical protein
MAANPANYVIGGLTVAITRTTADGGNNVATDVGGLDAGSGGSLTPAYETYSPDVEQELFASIFRYMKKSFKLAFTMVEPILYNIKNSWDIRAATSGSNPVLLSFGQSAAADFIPAPLVIAVTMFTPGAGSPASLRTITLDKAYGDTPGELKITKKGVSTLPCTYNGAYNASTSRVGGFSDVTT